MFITKDEHIRKTFSTVYACCHWNFS